MTSDGRDVRPKEGLLLAAWVLGGKFSGHSELAPPPPNPGPSRDAGPLGRGDSVRPSPRVGWAWAGLGPPSPLETPVLSCLRCTCRRGGCPGPSATGCTEEWGSPRDLVPFSCSRVYGRDASVHEVVEKLPGGGEPGAEAESDSRECLDRTWAGALRGLWVRASLAVPRGPPCPEAASADTQGPQRPDTFAQKDVLLSASGCHSTPKLIRVLLNEVQGSLSIKRSGSDSRHRVRVLPPAPAQSGRRRPSAWGRASYSGPGSARPLGGGTQALGGSAATPAGTEIVRAPTAQLKRPASPPGARADAEGGFPAQRAVGGRWMTARSARELAAAGAGPSAGGARADAWEQQVRRAVVRQGGAAVSSWRRREPPDGIGRRSFLRRGRGRRRGRASLADPRLQGRLRVGGRQGRAQSRIHELEKQVASLQRQVSGDRVQPGSPRAGEAVFISLSRLPSSPEAAKTSVPLQSRAAVPRSAGNLRSGTCVCVEGGIHPACPVLRAPTGGLHAAFPCCVVGWPP